MPDEFLDNLDELGPNEDFGELFYEDIIGGEGKC